MLFLAKDPDDVLDYTRNASAWLQTGEEIATSAWEIEGPDDALLLGTSSYAPTFGADSATCWLSGGTALKSYTVRNTIVTDASPARTKVLSFVLKIEKR